MGKEGEDEARRKKKRAGGKERVSMSKMKLGMMCREIVVENMGKRMCRLISESRNSRQGSGEMLKELRRELNRCVEAVMKR